MKTSLLTTSICLFILTTAVGQRPCDTLVLTDGRRIPAQIIRSKEGAIYFYKCEDFVKNELSITRTEVVELLPFQKKNSDESRNSQKPFARSSTQKWQKNSFVATVGFSMADVLSFQTDPESASAFQFGLQYNPKKTLYQVALFARPLRYYSRTFYDNFKTQWPNAEFTLTVKKLTYGRLTGLLKSGYIGLDFQIGSRSYTYTDEVFNLGIRNFHTKTLNLAFLARFGIQETLGMFFFDVSISAGPRSHSTQTTGGLYKETYNHRSISIQPALSVGLHF
ncbi:MAG TPA: hypothetical protein VK168_06270 [Saprospiraceae bacterium]|nr:hypothetical protein [Saprospiraceae bacterium]